MARGIQTSTQVSKASRKRQLKARNQFASGWADASRKKSIQCVLAHSLRRPVTERCPDPQKKAATSHELGVVNLHVRMPVQRPCACNGDTRHARRRRQRAFCLARPAHKRKRKKDVNAACPVLSGKARGGEAVTRSACTVGSLLMYMYTYSYTYSYTYRYVECPQELCAA